MSIKHKYIITSTESMKTLGEKMAENVLGKTLQKQAFVLSLQGNLGSGKTTFCQGFAKGLGIKEKILSPTFVLMKKFKIPKIKRYFYHFDCYRIKKADLKELNFEQIIQNPINIVAIEWSENIKYKGDLDLVFDFLEDNKRLVYCREKAR